MPAIDETLLPTVLLRHELPDGTWHVDWLIGQDSEGRQPLIAFRLQTPLDQLRPGQAIVAERLADHRPLYLGYEGPVSGERGRVARLASGFVRPLAQDSQRWRMMVEWATPRENPGSMLLDLVWMEGQRWQLTVASP